ncbi:MAG: hypothetical protein KGJ34_00595 [Patescibacteria group bacterium]|nr:hypothetical protein [Patescibacteria group bacterium]
MSWAMRRKLLYGGVTALVALIIILWIGFHFFATAPSCFDGKQDQGETGIDCGGPCARICSDEARAPVVLWSRAFQTAPGVYTAAAYVENPNSAQNAGAYSVPYAFRLFDSNNVLIVERDGVMDIEPQQVVPVIEANIPTGTRTVAHTFFEFSTNAIQWTKIPQSSLPSIEVEGENLSSDGSSLSVSIVNAGDSAISNLTLAAVLFDASSTAQAASESLLQPIAPGSSQNVVFTWPSGVPNVIRAEITPLPALPAQS